MAMVSAAARKPPLINRRGPMWAYTLPAITDEIMIPNACGNVVRPLASGVMPRRSCKYNGITNVTTEKARHGEQADEVALTEHSVVQQPEVEHRARDPQLDHGHGNRGDHADHPARDDERRRPARQWPSLSV